MDRSLAQAGTHWGVTRTARVSQWQQLQRSSFWPCQQNLVVRVQPHVLRAQSTLTRMVFAHSEVQL
jgi:hypothetical protein